MTEQQIILNSFETSVYNAQDQKVPILVAPLFSKS